MTDFIQFEPDSLIGSIQATTGETYFPDIQWYEAHDINDGILYRFDAGLLKNMTYLSCDLLLDTTHHTVFMLQLQEGADGRTFWFSFSLLHQCQGRLRVPLSATLQNQWLYWREGAVLKRLSRGERVDLNQVDRMRFIVHRHGGLSTRWGMSPIQASVAEPPILTDPILPKGVLLDEFGQSTLRDWSNKTRDENTLVSRIQAQAGEASQAQFPDGFSKWGGDLEKQAEATGYFRVAYDGEAWQMFDPDGYAFWSIGQCLIRSGIDSAFTNLEAALTWLPKDDPKFAKAIRAIDRPYDGKQQIANYLQMNLVRALGDEWRNTWKQIVVGWLKAWGFNTIANFSDWRVGHEFAFPYVRQMSYNFQRSVKIYRDLPDVFHPDFALDATDFAQQLLETRDDPAMIGYFLMNEPTWGFTKESLAAGILANAPKCATRSKMAEWLREQYQDEAALGEAWGMDVSFSMVAEGLWTQVLTEKAEADLYRLSTKIIDHFFSTLSAACQIVDPNHLNLGARFHTVPPDWVLEGMSSFDVFSINCYQPQVPADSLAHIHEVVNLPTIIGEWHFGALDVGLPASGIGHVHDQKARGDAYRYYVEQAATLPHCLGTHHFTLYDQSALGRGDGETYNIGFVDVCHQPYDELVQAAQKAHEKVYAIRRGVTEAFTTRPDYLPRLFF